MILKHGSPSDAPLIYDILSTEMWPEVGQGQINPGKAYDRIQHCLTEGIVFNIWDHGELAATAGMFMSSTWWSDELRLTDSWIFVREKWRKSRAIFMLMRAIKSLPGPVYVGIGSDVDIDRKAKLFARFGRPVGILYKVK